MLHNRELLREQKLLHEQTKFIKLFSKNCYAHLTDNVFVCVIFTSLPHGVLGNGDGPLHVHRERMWVCVSMCEYVCE